MDQRELLISRLMSNYGIGNRTELMDYLQNHGMVSDLCVSLDEVADSDLMRAYNATQPRNTP